MGNSFAFSRPRGIKGNYAVEITFELLPSEYALVSAERSSENTQPIAQPLKADQRAKQSCGKRVLTYLLDRIVAGDTITIDLQSCGKELLQRVVLTATMHGFTLKRACVYTTIDAWLSDQGAIALIDRDPQESAEQLGVEFPTLTIRLLEIAGGFQIRQLTSNTGINDAPAKLMDVLVAELLPGVAGQRLLKQGRKYEYYSTGDK